MSRQTKPYERRLDDRLVLRSVHDERDVARFAHFNGTINGVDQGAFTFTGSISSVGSLP